MKKLMLAVAIVCAAAMSQAAVINWSLTSVANSPDATAAKDWAIYLVDASKYDAFTALEGDAIAKFFDTASNYKEMGATSAARTGGVNANFSKQGSYASSETVSAFIVLFDNASAAAAGNYAYTAVGSATIAADGSDGAVNFGTFADAMKATGSSAGWQSTAGSVPEPTSGLPLLLGMAGLALKRRRA